MNTIYNWSHELSQGKKKRKLTQVLETINGIGKTTAIKICTELGVSPSILAGSIDNSLLAALQRLLIDKYAIQAEAKQIEVVYIQEQIANRTYRGKRHQMRLPVRGQRTRSNARTQRKLGSSRIQFVSK